MRFYEHYQNPFGPLSTPIRTKPCDNQPTRPTVADSHSSSVVIKLGLLTKFSYSSTTTPKVKKSKGSLYFIMLSSTSTEWPHLSHFTVSMVIFHSDDVKIREYLFSTCFICSESKPAPYNIFASRGCSIVNSSTPIRLVSCKLASLRSALSVLLF